MFSMIKINSTIIILLSSSAFLFIVIRLVFVRQNGNNNIFPVIGYKEGVLSPPYPISNHNHSIINITELYSKTNNKSSIDSIGQSFCSYIKTHPKEPRFVFYNRQPKAGSSTMQTLFQELSIKNKWINYNTRKNFWVSIWNKQLENEFKKNINYYSSNGKYRLIANGHWSQHIFNSFQNDQAEYIQLIRDCNSRSLSSVLYDLFMSAEALKASKTWINSFPFFKENTQESRVRDRLRITNKSMTVDECFNSYECFSNSKYMKKIGNDEKHFISDNNNLQFICGSECQRNYKLYNGSMLNIHNPLAFTAVGTLSNLVIYLELLECLYPNMLRGIVNEYLNNEIHAREFDANSIHHTKTPTMIKVIKEHCISSANDYDKVYEEAEIILISKYLYMKEHRNECCRINKSNI